MSVGPNSKLLVEVQHTKQGGGDAMARIGCSNFPHCGNKIWEALV